MSAMERVWSEAQQRALDLVLSGKSVLVTGAGGAGKSALIDEMKRVMGERRLLLAVTATTGIAAVNIGGKTLHSLMRVSPMDVESKTKEELAQKVGKMRHFGEEMRTLKAIIIDEVSMLDRSEEHTSELQSQR